MADMTTRERVLRMFEHREADRIPITDNPWGATVARWRREGMPQGVSFAEYFGMDRVINLAVDSSPRYEEKIVEETDEYIIRTTRWGATLRNWKHAAGVPEFLDFVIKDPDSWRKAKERMTPTSDRIPWDELKANFPKWREQGCWLNFGLFFGFDALHSWVVGTERILIAMMEEPEWYFEMANHLLDVRLALLEMVWEAGYHFDGVRWMEDMGYKENQFFSLETYRELVKPVQKRAIEWAHAKGIKAELHSCGNITPFIPELVEMGLDSLNPLEVKAGMDPIEIKRLYGSHLVLHGGINAVLYDDMDAMEAELRRVVPVMKENGGYIFASDHSVPSTVSLEAFKRLIDQAKELGRYD